MTRSRWLKEDNQCPTFVYTSFKQQSIAKDIPSLRNEVGVLVPRWHGVSIIARNHFMNLFGNAPNIFEEAMEEVLGACQQQILEESRQALEKPITLEELGRVVDQMPRNKVTGRDGVPIEFYTETWVYSGPVQLEVLRRGLTNGSTHPKLMEGLIVLLPKKGDQTLIGNKRESRCSIVH